jgi:azurin
MAALVLSTALVLVLAACGENAPRPDADSPRGATTPNPAVGAALAGAQPAALPRPDESGRLRIEVSDAMRFNVKRFEVVSGERVAIELAHTGTFPKEAMGHNLVILDPAGDLDMFALRAASARATDFIPAGFETAIVAHSELIGGGETTRFEFVAPAPGTYPFLCTFPGHSAMMRGEMIVRSSDRAPQI